MNFSLRQKIFLGYIVMISFTLLVGMYAIFSLKELNAITRLSLILRLMKTDTPQ
jgi:hypothetical protein